GAEVERGLRRGLALPARRTLELDQAHGERVVLPRRLRELLVVAVVAVADAADERVRTEGGRRRARGLEQLRGGGEVAVEEITQRELLLEGRPRVRAREDEAIELGRLLRRARDHVLQEPDVAPPRLLA